jgi:hypothetical protein
MLVPVQGPARVSAQVLARVSAQVPKAMVRMVSKPVPARGLEP